MASEQNYLETTAASKWCDEVNDLLADTNTTLKNASQLLKDLATENKGTLGDTLNQQGSEFVTSFTQMANGFAKCVEVVAKHIMSVVKNVAENKELLGIAAKVLGVALGI